MTLRIAGAVPAEVWNRLGTRLIPRLRQAGATQFRVGIELEVTADPQTARYIEGEVHQALDELALTGRLRIHTVAADSPPEIAPGREESD